jgi:regulator of cell morphogenesis and NO signaling
MKNLTAQMSVGEIASGRPASVRIFERYQIDFCCGGQTTLETACRGKGADAAALLADIERAGTPRIDERQWSAAPVGELIGHILSTHHAYLKAELPRLATTLDRIERKHDGRYPAAVALAPVFHALHAELDSHLLKEEQVLFPLIRSLELAQSSGSAPPPAHCGSVRNPVRMMCREHDSAGEALALLREITDGYAVPADACNTFRAFYYELEELERDLHRHIHLENNILFPRAIDLEASL